MLPELPLPPAPPPSSPPPPRPRLRTLTFCILLASLLGAALGSAATLTLSSARSPLLTPTPTPSAPAPSPPPGASALPTSPALPALSPGSYAEVAAAVLPSVVSIEVVSRGRRGSGSGVILSESGEILTNDHVIAAAAGASGSIRVVFHDETSAAATVVGRDAASDLALIRTARRDLTPAQLGSTSTLRVGDPVLALGSPLGLPGTVTAGIVSALARPVNTTDDPDATVSTVLNAIQTDAAVNPGNSGGPLVDAQGRVVGINSAIATLGTEGAAGSIGLGFAIPIDQARAVADQLRATGRAVHAVLGVVPAERSTAERGREVFIAELPPGPAASAGLRVRDVILAVAGEQVHTANELVATVRTHRVGEVVEVRVLRDELIMEIPVTLGSSG